MRILYFILLVIILSASIFAQNNKANSNVETRSLRVIEAKDSLPLEIIEFSNTAANKALAGNFKDAIPDFRQLVEKYPTVYQFQYNLARCLIGTDADEEALAILIKVTDLQPNHFDALASIGEIYFNKGMNKESLEYFQQAFILNPNDFIVNNNLGTTFYKLGKLAESLQYLDSSIKLNPDYANAYNNRGVTLYAIGKVKEAINDFKKASLLDPNFAEPFNNLGIAYSKLNKLDDAHRAFLAAVRLRPDWSNALYNLAISHITRGERELARTRLETLSQYDSGLAEKVQKVLWQKYVVNASAFKEK